MGFHGFVPALVQVRRHFAFKSEIRIIPPDEVQRNPVKNLPAVLRPAGPDLEEGLRVLPGQLGPAVPAGAQLGVQAAVGVDFEVEVPVPSGGKEEELQAAVLVDGGSRGSVFRPDSATLIWM